MLWFEVVLPPKSINEASCTEILAECRHTQKKPLAILQVKDFKCLLHHCTKRSGGNLSSVGRCVYKHSSERALWCHTSCW